MKDQKRKGRITELQVYAKLLQYGEISIPYGNNGIKSTVNLVQYFLPEIQLKQYL